MERPNIAAFTKKMFQQIAVGKMVSDPHLMDGLDTPYVDEREYFGPVDPEQGKSEIENGE